MKHFTNDQRGSSLMATLAASVVVMPLAAFAVLLTRMDFYVQHNTRAQVEAFYAAEAGLEQALADIPPLNNFDRLVHGPDGIAGTADDGEFSFGQGAPGYFPRAPIGYVVRVQNVTASQIRITSTGSGVHNAQAVVGALVERSPAPYVPSAVYGVEVGTIAVGADFLVSGFDHADGDPPGAPTGSAPAQPAISCDTDSAASQLRNAMQSGEAERIVGAGGTASIAASASIDLMPLAALIATSATAIRVSSTDLSGVVQLGTPMGPQLTILTDNGAITGAVEGAGILSAPAGLRVQGSLRFRGIILSGGDVVADASSTLQLEGAMWLSGPPPTVALLGAGAVSYSAAAVAEVDRWMVGALPHAAIVTGWFESR